MSDDTDILTKAHIALQDALVARITHPSFKLSLPSSRGISLEDFSAEKRDHYEFIGDIVLSTCVALTLTSRYSHENLGFLILMTQALTTNTVFEHLVLKSSLRSSSLVIHATKPKDISDLLHIIIGIYFSELKLDAVKKTLIWFEAAFDDLISVAHSVYSEFFPHASSNKRGRESIGDEDRNHKRTRASVDSDELRMQVEDSIVHYVNLQMKTEPSTPELSYPPLDLVTEANKSITQDTISRDTSPGKSVVTDSRQRSLLEEAEGLLSSSRPDEAATIFPNGRPDARDEGTVDDSRLQHTAVSACVPEFRRGPPLLFLASATAVGKRASVGTGHMHPTGSPQSTCHIEHPVDVPNLPETSHTDHVLRQCNDNREELSDDNHLASPRVVPRKLIRRTRTLRHPKQVNTAPAAIQDEMLNEAHPTVPLSSLPVIPAITSPRSFAKRITPMPRTPEPPGWLFDSLEERRAWLDSCLMGECSDTPRTPVFDY